MDKEDLPVKRKRGRPKKSANANEQAISKIKKVRPTKRTVEPKKKKKLEANEYVPTLAMLAQALEIGTSTANRYLRKGMKANCKSKAGYNIRLAREWIETSKTIKVPDAEQDTEDLKFLKLRGQVRKLHQEARGRKLRNDEYEGLLLPADDVRQWIASRFLRIRSRMQQLPAELQMLAPSHLRSQLHADLSNAIHGVLVEMSTWSNQAEKNKEFQDVV